jgi:hypothetical protein
VEGRGGDGACILKGKGRGHGLEERRVRDAAARLRPLGGDGVSRGGR